MNLTIEQMREILVAAPEGAEAWWDHRKCYAKDTISNSFPDLLLGSDETTSTPIYVNGEWTTYSSSESPNLITLNSMRIAVDSEHTSPTTLLKKGDQVLVDFTSESRTVFSGKRFVGRGVLDRVEDGRVYGRLDNGNPFMCFYNDVRLIEE